MRSIIQNDKRCFVCGATQALEEHHIFGGANRAKSERYGLKVRLCHWHHNEPPEGAHFNSELNERLKQIGQRAFEARFGTRTEFMKEFGKNWLD